MDVYVTLEENVDSSKSQEKEIFWANFDGEESFFVSLGIYDALYHSHRKQAKTIVPALSSGLLVLEFIPERFEAPKEGTVEKLKELLTICENNPEAILHESY